MMLRWLPVVTLACLLSRDSVISKSIRSQMNSLADYADLDASFQEDIETVEDAKCDMSCDAKHYMNCSSGTYGECRACSICGSGYRTGCGGMSAGTCGEQCEPHERVSDDEDNICVPLLSLQLKADVFTNRYDAHYPTTQCSKKITYGSENRWTGGILNDDLAFEADPSNYTMITERCDMVNNFADRGLPILLTHQARHHMCSNYLATLKDCEEQIDCIPPPVTQALRITMFDTNQQPIDALTKMAYVPVCTDSMVWGYFEGHQVKTIVVEIVTKYTADVLDLENTSDSVDMITGVQLLPPNLLYKGVPADDVGNQGGHLTAVEGRQGGSQAVKLNSDYHHYTVKRTTPEPWTVNLHDTAFGGQYSLSYVNSWKPLVFLHADVQVPPCENANDDRKYSAEITFRKRKAFSEEVAPFATIELPETDCAQSPIWYPMGAVVKLQEDAIQDIYVDTFKGKDVAFANIRISVISEAVTKRFRQESPETIPTKSARSKRKHDHFVVTPAISSSTDRAILDTIMNTSGSSYSNDQFTDCPAVVLGKLLLLDDGDYERGRGCLSFQKKAPSILHVIGSQIMILGGFALSILYLPEDLVIVAEISSITPLILDASVKMTEKNFEGVLEAVDVLVIMYISSWALAVPLTFETEAVETLAADEAQTKTATQELIEFVSENTHLLSKHGE